jgi:shikimate dehydrogenase
VSCALLLLGVERLVLADVDPARAQALAESLQVRFGADRVTTQSITALTTDEVDGIVNATPMGMAASPQSAIAPDLILSRHWVADIVYFPLETEFLRAARRKGCRVLNGSGMVVAQAAKAFEIMTGRPAALERMRASFDSPDFQPDI